MTLNKQLLLSIIIIILTNSLVSFVILFHSAQRSTEERLYLKNIDDANSLALVLTQAEKSPASVRLMLSAKFDAGHYSEIRLDGFDGDVIEQIIYEGEVSSSPKWFQRIASLDVPYGVAQVSDGWEQFGTIYVRSQTAFAMDMLWEKFQHFVVSILVLSVVICGLSSLVLRLILKPLSAIVDQANSFSERRFIKIDKPWTTDFARVVVAMNSLAERFKANLLENTARLEDGRRKEQHDPVTDIPNINAFFTLLESQLRYRDKDGQNALIVHSIAKQQGDIQALAPNVYDTFFALFANAIRNYYLSEPTIYTDFRIARINETDICVLLTECLNLDAILLKFSEAEPVLQHPELRDAAIHCVCAGVYISPDESSYDLLGRLDDLLEHVQNSGIVSGYSVEPVPNSGYHCESEAQWQADFSEIIDKIDIVAVPIKTAQGGSFHHQLLCEFNDNGRQRNISRFTEPARRFGFVPRIDEANVSSALKWLSENTERHGAVLLYEESIATKQEREILVELLKKWPDAAQSIGIRTS